MYLRFQPAPFSLLVVIIVARYDFQVLIFFLTLGAAFARNPIGLAAIALMVFSIMLLNNKFAEAAGLAIAKAAKNVSPQLAAAV